MADMAPLLAVCTLIQILARFFSPDTVKTGHCHIYRAELCVKRGKGAFAPFQLAQTARP